MAISSVSCAINMAVDVLPAAVTPSCVTAEVFVKVLPATFKLLPNESDPVEIDPHGELLVFFLDFPVTRTLLGERLMVKG